MRKLIKLVSWSMQYRNLNQQVFGNKSDWPYHWNDSGSHVGKLDTALVQAAHKQLSIFAGVLMFHRIVGLDNLLLQHKHHLTDHQQPTSAC